MARTAFQMSTIGLAIIAEPAAVERGVKEVGTWLNWGEQISPSTDNDAARDVARDIAGESAQCVDTLSIKHPGASR